MNCHVLDPYFVLDPLQHRRYTENEGSERLCLAWAVRKLGGGPFFHGPICCQENDDRCPPTTVSAVNPKTVKNLKDFQVKYLIWKSFNKFFDCFKVRGIGGGRKKTPFSPQHIRPWKKKSPGICKKRKLPLPAQKLCLTRYYSSVGAKFEWKIGLYR